MSPVLPQDRAPSPIWAFQLVLPVRKAPAQGWAGRGVPPYLDGGTCEAGELLDVLPLLADDGADRLRGDEDVHGLLLWRLRGQCHRSGLSVTTRMALQAPSR